LATKMYLDQSLCS